MLCATHGLGYGLGYDARKIARPDSSKHWLLLDGLCHPASSLAFSSFQQGAFFHQDQRVPSVALQNCRLVGKVS